MANQPVPDVTDADVRRIALRDFGESQLPLVQSLLEEYGKQEWNRPGARVRLAILKLAQGDMDRLLDAISVAIEDPRDVLAQAEYPGYMREIGFGKVAENVKQSVIDDDWRQYHDWLEKK